MKIKILKVLCGGEQPLPTHSLMRLFAMTCIFVFSSYVHADALPIVVEKAAYIPNLGFMALTAFGLCSLVVVRRRKQWITDNQ